MIIPMMQYSVDILPLKSPHFTAQGTSYENQPSQIVTIGTLPAEGPQPREYANRQSSKQHLEYSFDEIPLLVGSVMGV